MCTSIPSHDPSRGSPAAATAARRWVARWVLAAALVLAAGLAAAGPARIDPASRLPAGDDASESWDVTAVFESGHRFFARWMITNEGPGDRSAIAIGHLVFPDGRVVPFKNGRRAGRWELSDDGRRIRVASSILDQSGDPGRVEIDKNSDGIRIALQFERGAPGASGEEGAGAVDGGSGFDVLATNAPVHGSVWVRGMPAPVEVRGRLAVTHAWTDVSDSTRELRRIEFLAPGESIAIHLSDVLAPDGTRGRQLLVERDGVALVRTGEFALEIEPSPSSDEDYPIPAALRIDSARVTGEIRLGRVLVAHDPMEALPQPFRFLLSFKSRPQRVWVDSVYELRIALAPPDAPSSDAAADALRGRDSGGRDAGGIDANGIDVRGIDAPPAPEGSTQPGDHRLAIRGTGITNLSFTNPLRVE